MKKREMAMIFKDTESDERRCFSIDDATRANKELAVDMRGKKGG
jgi:hypothetical protein